MIPDLFRNVVIDSARQKSFEQLPTASICYFIFFTPRSGSSLLTDLISATGRLGPGNEAFNPEFIPSIAQAIQAPDMDTYIKMLLRRFNTYGVYGAEVTAHQINALFQGYAAFHKHFGITPSFWLIRQDIVAQAVSLAKMVTTKVAHTASSDAITREAAEKKFAYDATLIKYWLQHIHAAEVASETWFSEYGLDPLRMSYEQMICLSPLQIVNVITRHLGVPQIAPMSFPSRHAKLGTDQNTRFADRFREEQTKFMVGVDSVRAPMLARLHPITRMVSDHDRPIAFGQ